MPTTSCWKPSGHGGVSGWPSTSWRSGTEIAWSRPGRASSAATGLVFDLSKRNITLDCTPSGRFVTTPCRCSSLPARGDEEVDELPDRGGQRGDVGEGRGAQDLAGSIELRGAQQASAFECHNGAVRGVELHRQGDELEDHDGEEEDEADVDQPGRAEDEPQEGREDPQLRAKRSR